MATTTKTKKVEKAAPAGNKMEASVFNKDGKSAGTFMLPENIFGLPWNADLVHQVVTAMQANARGPVAHTKDRGEVRGGGKKPWKQKGTGRARHGSSRSPIWKGGGVTHGPRNEKIYAQKINRQARQKALLVTLSRKYKDGEVLFIDSLELSSPKTAQAKILLAALGKTFSGLSKAKNAALIAIPRVHVATQKSFQNFGNVEMVEVRNLNPVSVLSSKYLIIAEPAAAMETLGAKKVVKK
ncbi:MAG TPA: 50S ribosomal protein L4 [Candidatus Paceibacterota bacterium]|nr:50S ribosomal protein L4 [Candidatus Paceibacterota bacterium]